MVITAKSAEAAMPKRVSLPSMLPPGASCTGDLGRLVGAGGRQQRVAVLLGDRGDGDADQEEHAHRGEDRPALLRVPDHLAEGVGQPGGDREDEQHLDEVGEAASGSRTGGRSWR